MKALQQGVLRLAVAGLVRTCAASVLVAGISVGWKSWASEAPKTYDTPEQAVAALAAVVQAQDRAALAQLFGAAGAELTNPDRVQSTNEYELFTAAFAKAHRIVKETDSRCILEAGEASWPFPIPIIRKEGLWYFDAEAGREELLNRRIGRNELEVLRVMRAYVAAQREYASQDRDGDEVLEYAQRLGSTPGLRDGLFWESGEWEEPSPLGPLVVQAQGEGYAMKSGDSPEPFHGYYFKILLRQGPGAPGGKYAYVINGNMIGGFGMVAWPAVHGDSGVMSFIVNQQGRVYEKDLGKKTSSLVSKMTAYDLDGSWALSRD